MKQKIVVLTGAGISAESGLSTFRDSDGLWENYRIEDVCTPEALIRNRPLVIDFYNQRRKATLAAQPNAAHHALKRLEQKFEVCIVTQNVDNLHERAGSSKVLHLHGELMKIRSMRRDDRIYDLSPDNLETTTETLDKYGDHVRPHIVFFNEDVPNITRAIELAGEADIFVVIGTSLNVYPAASLLHFVKAGTPIYYIDPHPAHVEVPNLTVIAKKATEGVAELVEILSGKA
ncbi:MAG: SIR2 family NAD-dependent protein deacylase [Muribaculaceae bacterium]